MKDDQRKGEGLKSGGGGGLSFLLGVVFFLVMVVISLSSVWVWDQSSSHEA